jgi:hypothetical protein
MGKTFTSTFKMETLSSFEMFVSTHETTGCHSAEDYNLFFFVIQCKMVLQ